MAAPTSGGSVLDPRAYDWDTVSEEDVMEGGGAQESGAEEDFATLFGLILKSLILGVG